ncbi:hypothetical protein QWY20_05880 [Alkalimonas sp. MEB108]|uniref:Uncharacterized protein n=1 Tax=Alkalimonas cellulosilytica TaxID=3058395 RepID=A0ABU7J3A4_9GAMM|nr:hypothetical protein [Alkalimonas sp. MEB108]MEE2000976.1 hypothetical protein [Alkalimonas sp. MEB108]
MRKVFEFTLAPHQVKITNSWLHGAKLYVDGELRDFDKTFLATSHHTLLSANLGELGVLEIKPVSKLLSVEMDAYLVNEASSHLVYSSYQRVSFSGRRLLAMNNVKDSKQ